MMRSPSSLVVLRTLALLVGLSLAAEVARADAVIDNFTTGQSISSGAGVGVFGPISSTVGGGGILGGSRSISLSGNASVGETVSAAVGGGFAGYQSGPNSTGIAAFTYNGGGGGLGNLLAMTAFIDVSVIAFNAGSNSVASTMSVTVDDGSTTATRSVSLGGSTLIPQVFSFDFTAAGLDFNNVNSVTLTLDSTGAIGADMALNGFIARMTAIPEPAAVAVWSVLGVVGLVAGCKLRRPRGATRA